MTLSALPPSLLPCRSAHAARMAAPGALERRSEERTRSVLRVGKIIGPDRETLCLIRNISTGGLMAHVYCAFAPCEPVAIEIRNGHVQTGHVAWYQDGHAGLAFDARIDVLHFLADEQTERLRGILPRAPRLKVDDQAMLRAHGEVHTVAVHDISQGGAKVDLEEPLGPAVSEDVLLSVPGLETMAGSIRWRADGHAGISFHRLVAFDTLAQWAAAH